MLSEEAEGHGKPALMPVGRMRLGILDCLRLGNVSTNVLRAATRPVLVCPS